MASSSLTDRGSDEVRAGEVYPRASPERATAMEQGLNTQPYLRTGAGAGSREKKDGWEEGGYGYVPESNPVNYSRPGTGHKPAGGAPSSFARQVDRGNSQEYDNAKSLKPGGRKRRSMPGNDPESDRCASMFIKLNILIVLLVALMMTYRHGDLDRFLGRFGMAARPDGTKAPADGGRQDAKLSPDTGFDDIGDQIEGADNADAVDSDTVPEIK